MTEDNNFDELESAIDEYKKNSIASELSNNLLKQNQHLILREIRSRYAKVMNSIDGDSVKIISETIPMNTFINSAIKFNALNDTFTISSNDKTNVITVDKNNSDLYNAIMKIHNQINKEVIELTTLLEKTKNENTKEEYETSLEEIVNTYYSLIDVTANINFDAINKADDVIKNIYNFKMDGDKIVGKIPNDNQLSDIIITEDGEYKDLYVAANMALNQLALADLLFVPEDITYQNPASLTRTSITSMGRKNIKVDANATEKLDTNNIVEPITGIPDLDIIKEEEKSELLEKQELEKFSIEIGIPELSEYESMEMVQDNIYSIIRDLKCDYNKKVEFIKALNYDRKKEKILKDYIYYEENRNGRLMVNKKLSIKLANTANLVICSPYHCTVGRLFKWGKNVRNRRENPIIGPATMKIQEYKNKKALKKEAKEAERASSEKNEFHPESETEYVKPESETEYAKPESETENKTEYVKPESETENKTEYVKPESETENKTEYFKLEYISLLDNTCRVLEEDNLDDNKKIDMDGLKKSLDKFGISMDSYKEFSSRRQQKSIINYINEKHVKEFTDDLHEKVAKNREIVIAETNKKIAEELKKLELEKMKDSLNFVKSPNISMNHYLMDEIIAAKESNEVENPKTTLVTNSNELPTNFNDELNQLFNTPVEDKGKSK